MAAQLDLGVIFCLGLDGKGFRLLHSFAGRPADGANPLGALAVEGSVLYGATYYGGEKGAGTVFKINLDGSGHESLQHFHVTKTTQRGCTQQGL